MYGGVSTGILNQIRKRYARALPYTCSVKRQSRINSPSAGSSKGPAVVVDNVRCRPNPLKDPILREEGSKTVVVADYAVFLGAEDREPDALDVQSGDDIVVSETGEVYRVIDTNQGRGENIGLTATCKQVE